MFTNTKQKTNKYYSLHFLNDKIVETRTDNML